MIPLPLNDITTMLKYIFTFLLLLGATSTSAQLLQHRFAKVETDSAKMAEYKEKIALDYSMPDYSVKKINESKIGTRLADILHYFEKSHDQRTYNSMISKIIREQNKALDYQYIGIRKVKLHSITKLADEITIKYNVMLGPNGANVKDTDISFLFKDGVSESDTVNELFSGIAHYIDAKK